MLSRWRTIARSLFHRRGFEEGLAEEMRFHLEQYTQDLISAGHSPEEAARRARIEFGNVDNVTLDCREARGLRVFDTLQQRLRYAARVLRKQPAFTATALATLAITVGANLAIFAIVDVVLLRPLPFREPDRLVAIYNTYPRAGVPDDGASVTNYYERRACHRRADERVALSRRRRHCRRSRRDRARVRDARHTGVLRDAGRASRPRAHLH